MSAKLKKQDTAWICDRIKEQQLTNYKQAVITIIINIYLASCAIYISAMQQKVLCLDNIVMKEINLKADIVMHFQFMYRSMFYKLCELWYLYI